MGCIGVIVLFKERPPQFPLCSFTRYIWSTCLGMQYSTCISVNKGPCLRTRQVPEFSKWRHTTVDNISTFSDFYWPSKAKVTNAQTHSPVLVSNCTNLNQEIKKRKNYLFFSSQGPQASQIPKQFKCMIVCLGYITEFYGNRFTNYIGYFTGDQFANLPFL